MNRLNLIRPYRVGNLWAFDDEARGLLQEGFVPSASALIDEMVPPNCQQCSILFSAHPFPGHEIELQSQQVEASPNSGYWYYCSDLDMEIWLCEALGAYFDEPPATIYALIEA